jgi:uncharacterized membrane protein YfcA
MNAWAIPVIGIAGVGAGLINTVVGSGTLITFPALLAVGIPPLTANVSNTIGLFPGAFVGAHGYRHELEGQGRRALLLGAASVLGGLSGAALLLVLPPAAFQAIVPTLIAVALALVAFGPRFTAWMAQRGRSVSGQVGWPLWLLTMATGIYGGYFGAAQGVLLMGFLGILLADGMQRHNALKNVLAGLVNFVAAIVFALTTHVDWAAAGIVALGAIVGSLLGARIGRRLSPGALRAFIIMVGCAAIIKLVI